MTKSQQTIDSIMEKAVRTKRINKSDFITLLAARAKVSRSFAQYIYNVFWGEIHSLLLADCTVNLSKHGVFQLKKRKPRQVQSTGDFKTGEFREGGSTYGIKFYVSDVWRRKVKRDMREA